MFYEGSEQRQLVAAAVAKSKQRDGSVLSCLTHLLAATVSIIKGRGLTGFNNSDVHVCEYLDEEPNCVLHDADWFPGRRRAGRVIMWSLWVVLKDMGVSPICIGGS